MKRPSFTHVILASGLMISALLLWFAFANCKSALPVAQCYLRGVGLSLGQAIESIAISDPSLKLLSDFKSSDIAYFVVVDNHGRILFHTNPDLIGEQLEDTRFKAAFASNASTESRVKLGTGEVAFESQQQLHLPEGPQVLRIVLHTWQADQIIKRARAGGMTILLLLVAAWGFALWTLQLQRRDQQHREAMAKREHLAQLGELGAVLAHEVRTPLSGIKGYAQLLEERMDDTCQKRYSTKIVAESERLEGLVCDLLTYARQESMSEGAAKLSEELYGAWGSLEAAARQSGIILQVSGTSDLWVACPADRVRQLFLNLLGNAVQAMPDGGSLGVVVSCDQAMVTVMIDDSGAGFPVDSLQRVFDPFYTTRASGTGLGLAVCRKIVEGYGGTITAANNDGGGARILMKLPLGRETV